MINGINHTQRSWLIYLIFALWCLVVISIQSYRFAGRTYRDDEAWRVHAAVEHAVPETVRWLTNHFHPPLWMISLDLWVDAFGHDENITRFESTLYTVLILALTFRFAADLFGWQVALAAAFFLGATPFVLFYTHEVRPYPALMLCVIGTQWMFLRWLGKPTFKYALLFVLFGAATLYTHYSGAFLLFGLFICFLGLVRWDFGRYMRMVGLFAAIGLAFTGWLLPFIHSALLFNYGGVYYGYETDITSFQDIFARIRLIPPGLGDMLVLAALALPVTLAAPRGFRQLPPLRLASPGWRKWYLVITVGATVVTALLVNSFMIVIHRRNPIILMPTLAILMGFALVKLPRYLQVIVIGLAAVGAVTSSRDFEPTSPYNMIPEVMAADYQAGDSVIMDARFPWTHVVMSYYVQERLPVKVDVADIFYLMQGNQPKVEQMPVQPVHRAISDEPDMQARFIDFLNIKRTEYLWYVQYSGTSYNDTYKAILRTLSIPVAVYTLEDRPNFIVTRYRRAPDPAAVTFRFGDGLTLQLWTLLADVNVQTCQDVTLESWWRTSAVLPDDYSITLVLADSKGQGGARSDGALAESQTQLWQPDAPYLDERTLTIPCDLPAGEYPLLLSVYDPDDPTPGLSVTAGDGTPLGSQAYLTTLRVQP